MLKLGVFGGYYFQGQHNEYPKDWFKDAKLSNAGYDINFNFFKINKNYHKSKKKLWVSRKSNKNFG